MDMARWLITGAAGFLGRHVVAERNREGREPVVSIGRRPLDAAGVSAHVQVDLTDANALASAVEAIDPSIVVHAGGRTPPGTAEELYQQNVIGTLHLLDALRRLNHSVRVILVGSAAELGPVEAEDLPVSEDHPCHPADAYGLSKLLATTAGLASRAPLEVISARVFNPIGPGAPPSQAFGRFARELASGASATEPARLEVGDLESRRDFIDARDVATAIVALAERGEAGHVYNVGTGRSVRVGDGLDYLIAASGRRVEVVSRQEPRIGPVDSRADIHRIQSHTGWTPVVRWEQSLADLWDEVRGRFGCH
jgi:nucleoside-diphosphate-sugar epimerase